MCNLASTLDSCTSGGWERGKADLKKKYGLHVKIPGHNTDDAGEDNKWAPANYPPCIGVVYWIRVKTIMLN